MQTNTNTNNSATTSLKPILNPFKLNRGSFPRIRAKTLPLPTIEKCEVLGKWSGFIGNMLGEFVFSKDDDDNIKGYFKRVKSAKIDKVTGETSINSEFDQKSEYSFKQVKVEDGFIVFSMVGFGVNHLSGQIKSDKCFGIYIRYSGLYCTFESNYHWGMYR